MKISTILDQIDNGALALPEFQRGYVWNRDQVRGLMNSLYRRYPVGSLLVWLTRTENADARGGHALQPGTVKLLLDGQQRITTLYGIIRGRAPVFFQGNASAFANLHFHLDDEVFQFYGPVKMGGDPRWVDVTELMLQGVGEFAGRLFENEEMKGNFNHYLQRLNAVAGIREIDFHIDEVTGEDKTVDVVVEIFNKVNSGGTKLSKGDLALAKVCAEWPQARDELQQRLKKWDRAGFSFKLDWLLRNINTILTGEALFTALRDVEPSQFREGLVKAERHIDSLLNLIGSRLGLNHDRVLGSRYSFPLMVRYLEQRGGKFENHLERDRILFWYIHTMLWGRYAGSTETVLNRDLAAIEQAEGGLDRLIQELRQNRGDLKVHSDDFSGWSRGARFYPLLYLLTRVTQARDWDTGITLSATSLGAHTNLHLHHIFPKARLYKAGYDRTEVNALANFTFLTAETNIRVSDADPAEYFREFMARNPGVIESHWIPLDPVLWRVENYPAFLTARRELLAEAANTFLEELYGGPAPAEEGYVSEVVEREVASVPGGVEGDDELERLVACNAWVSAQGLPEGELLYELVEDDGSPLAYLDLAWPDGLQAGLSRPVTLLVDETEETEEVANRAGFLFFTNEEEFRNYVEREILARESLG